jgi:hypothetical protein
MRLLAKLRGRVMGHGEAAAPYIHRTAEIAAIALRLLAESATDREAGYSVVYPDRRTVDHSASRREAIDGVAM